MVKAMATAKVRPLGNRKSMNIGGLIFMIKKGVGEVKMAPEFFLAPSNVQLNLLDDWINELEDMYSAEAKEAGTLRERAKITKRTHVRTYDDTTD
jgi:hypothetical protein